MGALGRILGLAKHEVFRATGHADRKSAMVFLILAVIVGALTPSIMSQGVDLEAGLYRASVPQGHFLEPVLRGDSSFVVVDAANGFAALESGDVDLFVIGKEVRADDTDKGFAALAQLEKAARAYTIALMALESDDAAAFPVRVAVAYTAQAAPESSTLVPGGGAPTNGPPPLDDEGPAVEPRSDVQGNDAPADNPAPVAPTGNADSNGGFDFFGTESRVDTPAALSPPFPFKSLLLAYVFLIPMNFVVQVYASSVVNERLNRKGESLLASPARPWEIVLGKTLPYAALLLAVMIGLAWFIGGSWLSVVAMLPVALAFLALEFMAALMSRSFRELTFLTVFASVFLTIFCFLPAVFSDVHPIAFISPITLVVFDLKNQAIGLGAFLYATVPLTLASITLFVLGLALFTEEGLFHPRKPFERFLEAVSRLTRHVWSPLWLTGMLVPFAFLAELVLITFLFAWPFGATLPVILLCVAIVEESVKALPAAAAFRFGTVKATERNGLLLGLASGIGFFLMEKLVLIVSLAALLEVDAGASVFGAPALDLGVPWWLLLFFPLVLHMVTAAMSSVGAAKGKRFFRLAYVLAVVTHLLYNLAVAATIGGVG